MRITQDHWKQVLQRLIDARNWSHGSKPKSVSNKTMHERASFLFAFFTELRRNDERNYKVDPRHLGGRHIRFMVTRWVKRGLAPGTIRVYLSYLRVFEHWIGKPGLVLSPEAYVSDPGAVRRIYAAQEDKSWAGKSVIAADLIAKLDAYDPFVGAQLRLCHCYGLRVKEAIMCRPHLAEIGSVLVFTEQANCASYLEVNRGTKGGRLRYVPIDTPEKRAALEHAKRVALHETSSLAHPALSLKQAMKRFYNVVHRRFGISRAELGITAHGLRHQYVSERYEQRTGEPPPVRGGKPIDRELDRAARLSVANEVGHSRENVTTAYLGGILHQRGKHSRSTDESGTS